MCTLSWKIGKCGQSCYTKIHKKKQSNSSKENTERILRLVLAVRCLLSTRRELCLPIADCLGGRRLSLFAILVVCLMPVALDDQCCIGDLQLLAVSVLRLDHWISRKIILRHKLWWPSSPAMIEFQEQKVKSYHCPDDWSWWKERHCTLINCISLSHIYTISH